MGLQAGLACRELERPFFYPLLKMFVDLLQRFLDVPAFINFLDYGQGMEYVSIMAANRTNVESYPNRITGFLYETSLQLKVRDLPCGGGAALALIFFPIIFMYDVEVAKLRQFLCGVSEHPGERHICLTQASIRISSRDSQRTLLEGPPESLLTVTERHFRAFSNRKCRASRYPLVLLISGTHAYIASGQGLARRSHTQRRHRLRAYYGETSLHLCR